MPLPLVISPLIQNCYYIWIIPHILFLPVRLCYWSVYEPFILWVRHGEALHANAVAGATLPFYIYFLNSVGVFSHWESPAQVVWVHCTVPLQQLNKQTLLFFRFLYACKHIKVFYADFFFFKVLSSGHEGHTVLYPTESSFFPFFFFFFVLAWKMWVCVMISVRPACWLIYSMAQSLTLQLSWML